MSNPPETTYLAFSCQHLVTLLRCLPQLLSHPPHMGVGSNVDMAVFFLSLIQCQPSEMIPHRHGAVSGAPSTDWQALEVENCFSPTFSQPACSLTHSDRYITEGQ